MSNPITDSVVHPMASEVCPRFRHDIEWVRYSDMNKWVAKDPLRIAFFYFSECEFTAAKLCDGNRSITAIVQQLCRLFPEQSISITWFQVLANQWRQASLLMSTGSTSRVRRRQPPAVMRWLVQACASPLSIKVPLMRPSEYPSLLHRLATRLFHPWLVALGVILGIASFSGVLSAILRAPEQWVIDPTQFRGAGWLAIVLSYLLVKSLHELGHVLACIRWGAHCKEIGVMFLFFMPCLYCDTTDSWKLASRWKRAAISAGGIYVELWIAIFAAWVWLFSDDPFWSTFAASTLFVCTIGTLMINGNPFFRYDGYYLLSDIWGVPNLSEQSARALRRMLIVTLGGRRIERNEFDANPWLLAGFAIATQFYRTVMLVLLLWYAWYSLVPMGLGAIAILILVSATLAMVLASTRFVGGLASEFYAPIPIRAMRFSVMLGLLLLVVVAAMAVPIPDYVATRAVLDYADRVPMFATETAQLQSIGHIDQRIPKGQMICQMVCPEKQWEWLKKQAEAETIETRIRLLKQTSTQDASTAFELPTQLELLQELKNQIALLQPELESLTLRAPYDGFFVPDSAQLPSSIASPVHRQGTGPMIDVRRMGATFEKGTRLGWFTDRQQPIVKALVPESEIKSLRIGMHAVGIFDSSPFQPLPATITKLSTEPIERVPGELAGEPFLQTFRNENGWLKTKSPYYEVTLSVDYREDQATTPKQEGSIATVQIKRPPRTLFAQVTEWIYRTIRLGPK
jgi:putative peptide zinc metalloprotease protein